MIRYNKKLLESDFFFLPFLSRGFNKNANEVNTWINHFVFLLTSLFSQSKSLFWFLAFSSLLEDCVQPWWTTEVLLPPDTTPQVVHPSYRKHLCGSLWQELFLISAVLCRCRVDNKNPLLFFFCLLLRLISAALIWNISAAWWWCQDFNSSRTLHFWCLNKVSFLISCHKKQKSELMVCSW